MTRALTLTVLPLLLLPRLASAEATVSLRSVAVADPGRELDERLLETTINDLLPSVRSCYQKRIAKAGPIAGVVLAMMVFDAKGATKAVHVGGIGDAAVEKCVLAGLKKVTVMARLGKRGGVATVRLAFEPEGTGEPEGKPSSPSVDSGDPSVGGQLDKREVQAKIHKGVDRIKLCYDKELKADPAFEAKISVTFVIGSDGAVTSAQASGSSSATLHACVESVFRSLVFPKPAGGGVVKVTYPFVFKPAP